MVKVSKKATIIYKSEDSQRSNMLVGGDDLKLWISNNKGIFKFQGDHKTHKYNIIPVAGTTLDCIEIPWGASLAQSQSGKLVIPASIINYLNYFQFLSREEGEPNPTFFMWFYHKNSGLEGTIRTGSAEYIFVGSIKEDWEGKTTPLPTGVEGQSKEYLFNPGATTIRFDYGQKFELTYWLSESVYQAKHPQGNISLEGSIQTILPD